MIRKITEEDADDMLEWMHDLDVVECLNSNFVDKTKQDCIDFIKRSNENAKEKHFAVTNNNNDYLGTISLKNIDLNKKEAEMAIVLRKCAMGKGYANISIKELFEYGNSKFGIKTFYWYVKPDNLRAIRFYDKNGYKKCKPVIESPVNHNYVWYKYQSDL